MESLYEDHAATTPERFPKPGMNDLLYLWGELDFLL